MLSRWLARFVRRLLPKRILYAIESEIPNKVSGQGLSRCNRQLELLLIQFCSGSYRIVTKDHVILKSPLWGCVYQVKWERDEAWAYTKEGVLLTKLGKPF